MEAIATLLISGGVHAAMIDWETPLETTVVLPVKTSDQLFFRIIVE